MDHLHQIPGVGPPTNWMLEGNTVLGALAARTSRVSLGLMVGAVTYRNPALHAKITTTLDVVSGGRAIHAVGAAWFEDEHRAYGFEFPPLKTRFELLEEGLVIARQMFTQDEARFAGTHFRVDGALNNPRPIRGDIPILVGGSGERKTLRLVAQYADGCNVFGDPERVRHLMGVLDGALRRCRPRPNRDHADAARHALHRARRTRRRSGCSQSWPDRATLDPERLRMVLTLGTPDEVGEQVRALVAAGVEGLVLNMPNPYDLDAVALAGETLARGDGVGAGIQRSGRQHQPVAHSPFVEDVRRGGQHGDAPSDAGRVRIQRPRPAHRAESPDSLRSSSFVHTRIGCSASFASSSNSFAGSANRRPPTTDAARADGRSRSPRPSRTSPGRGAARLSTARIRARSSSYANGLAT